MWLLEHAFISGKADSCNLWAPQWLNAAHGGWAVLAASAVLERRPQHAPVCSGSEEKDINSTSSTSFLSCRSLPVTCFSGHPAEVSLSLFLPWASTRWATAASFPLWLAKSEIPQPDVQGLTLPVSRTSKTIYSNSSRCRWEYGDSLTKAALIC